MAVEKGKVLTAIELKFKGKSLTKNFKDNLATKWAAKIEKDEDIDGFIEDREDDVLEASNEADRRATQAAKKAKEDAAKAVTGKDDEPKEEQKLPDDTPEYMKAFLKRFDELSQTVQGIQQQKQTESLESRFRNDPRIKDSVPEFILKRAIPQKEEDFEATVTELAKEYGDFAKEKNLAGFGNDRPGTPRITPGAGINQGEEKPNEAVLAFAKSQNEKFIQQQSKN